MVDRLVIQIDGNSSGLQKALQSAETRLDNFNTRVSKSSFQLTNFIKKMQGVSASLGSFNSSVNSVAAANARLAASLNSIATRMQSVANATNRAGAASRQAAASTSGLNLGVRDLVMGMTSLNTVLYTSAFLFGGIVKSTIDANSRMEKMTVLLKNIANQGSETNNALYAKTGSEYLWDLAAKSPFKIEKLQSAFVKLKQNGIEPMTGPLQGLVDAIAHFGGGSEEIDHASVALSQMMSKGKVTMEDLRGQLAETGGIPSAITDMAEAAGFAKNNMNGFYAAMKKGAVDSADVVPKLLELWQKKYKGSADKMMGTWDGLMAQMSSAWQRMLVRDTQAQGGNSLFATIKREGEALTAWLKTSDADKFFSSLTTGLATVVSALVDGIQWLYKYRDTITAVGKAMLAIWAVGRVANVFSAIGSSIGGTIIAASRLQFLLLDLATSPNAVATSMALFGRQVTAAATSLGIFNSVGGIAYPMLGMVAGGAALAAVAIGGLAYAYYQGGKRIEESKTATVSYMNAQNDANKTLAYATDLSKQLMFAQGEEKKRLRELTVQTINNTSAKLNNASATYKQAMAEANAAKIKMVAAQDPYATVGGAIKEGGRGAIPNLLSALPMGGPVLRAGYDALYTSMFGSTKPGARESLAYNKATANAAQQKKVMETLLESIKVDMASLNNPLNLENQITDQTGGDGKKGPKDKLGSTDDKRGGLVSALNKIAEIEAKNKDLQAQLDDPKHEVSDKYQNEFADNSGAIDTANKGIADSIKSQDALNAATTAAQAKVKQLTVDQRALTRENATATKNMEALNNLQEKRVDQLERTEEAVGALGDGYSKIDSQVARFENKLREQYKAQLESNNALVAATAKTEVLTLVESRRTEILAIAAQKAKENADAIFESLLTEDQLRQVTFDREMARIEAQIEAAQRLTGVGTQEIRDNLLRERQAIILKKKVDENPFAKWAIGIKDVKAGINDTLTGSMDGFIDQLASGKLAFGDFAKSLVTDLIKIIVKAYIAKAILSALGMGGGMVSSFGTGGADTSAGSMGSVAAMYSAPSVPLFHGGGTVGSAGHGSGYKSVDPGIFAFAKRYHTGGFPGLAPGEVPIIAQKGEGVFTEEQMKAMGGSGGSSSGTPQAPTINIINQTGSDVQADQAQPRFDGEQMIVDVILKHGSKPGPVRNMMMGR